MRHSSAPRGRLPRAALLAGLLGLLAGGPSAHGNGLRLVSQDAFASARGEAFVATADNPSAVHYNPAGLAQLPGTQLRSGLYALDFNLRYQPPASASNAGNTYETKNDFALAPQLFLSHRLPSDRLAVGVGLYAPYGAAIEWPEDTGFRSVATQGELLHLRLNPALAARLTPALSVGAGVMVDYGDLSLEQGLLRFAQPFTNHFRFQGDGWSVGWHAGLLWQPVPSLSLGATFRSATAITFEGRTDLIQQPILPPTRRDAEAEFDFPWNAAVGLSWRPTPAWNLEINADYTDWGVLNDVLIRQTPAPPFPVRQNIPVNLHWAGSWLLSAGLTRYFTNGWHASAGYAFNENSVPDDYYSPLAADLDRHFFTLGAGRRGGRWEVDAAVQLGYGPAHEVSGSLPSSQPGLFSGQNADGTYRFVSVGVFVSVGRRF